MLRSGVARCELQRPRAGAGHRRHQRDQRSQPARGRGRGGKLAAEQPAGARDALLLDPRPSVLGGSRSKRTPDGQAVTYAMQPRQSRRGARSSSVLVSEPLASSADQHAPGRVASPSPRPRAHTSGCREAETGAHAGVAEARLDRCDGAGYVVVEPTRRGCGGLARLARCARGARLGGAGPSRGA